VVVDLAKTWSFFIIVLIHFYTQEQTWMNILNWVYKEKRLVEEIWEFMTNVFSYKWHEIVLDPRFMRCRPTLKILC
jgi:hypothetical protein